MDWGSTFLWAQIVGVMAICIGILSMQLKNSRHIILLEAPAGVLWGIQYIMLGASAGALVNFLVATRALGLAYAKQSYLIPIISVYLIAVWGIGIYNFNNWFDLLPLFSTTGGAFILFHRDNRPLIGRGLILTSSLWLAYGIAVGSWMGIGCAVFYITSCVVGIYRHENGSSQESLKDFLKCLLTIPPLQAKEAGYV